MLFFYLFKKDDLAQMLPYLAPICWLLDSIMKLMRRAFDCIAPFDTFLLARDATVYLSRGILGLSECLTPSFYSFTNLVLSSRNEKQHIMAVLNLSVR